MIYLVPIAIAMAFALTMGGVNLYIVARQSVDAMYPCSYYGPALPVEEIDTFRGMYGAAMLQKGYKPLENLKESLINYYTQFIKLPGIFDVISNVNMFNDLRKARNYFKANSEACCQTALDMANNKLGEKKELEKDREKLLKDKKSFEDSIDQSEARIKSLYDELQQRLKALEDAESQEIAGLEAEWKNSRRMESGLYGQWSACITGCPTVACSSACDKTYVPEITKESNLQLALEAEKDKVMENYARMKSDAETEYERNVEALQRVVSDNMILLQEIDRTLPIIEAKLAKVSLALEALGEVSKVYCKD